MRFPVNHALPLAALILLAGCGLGGSHVDSAPPPTSGPAADYPMVIGDPFVIDSVTYTPEDRLNYDAVGYAGLGPEGGTAISIAHKTLPLPSYVEVTSLGSGKTILARVERRGPMSNDRLIDLSPGAAIQLGISGGASAPVRVRRVNPPEGERSLLRSGQRAPERMETPKALLAVLMRKLTGAAPVTPAPAALPTSGPSATPAPVSAPKPKVKPGRRPVAAAVPAPAASASPAPEPAPAPAVRPAPARSGSLFVQAAAFSTRERAHGAAQALGGQVEPAGRLFRVRMGPFADRAEAQAALAKAKAAGYSDARIQSAR